METQDRIVTWRAGRFANELRPHWLLAVQGAADAAGDWDAALTKVLGRDHLRLVIGSSHWPTGELRVHYPPGGGRYVELLEGEHTFAEVWVPDPADWLAFNAAYIEPYLLTRATLHNTERVDRLANAIIAFARHGEGHHVDRETGESLIDRREEERYRRESAARRAASTPPTTD